ncbi:MAG TPA: Mur ligase domain-containing protein, partial [Bacteroidia bacterium]|nr:Mur ligase domain-containing protein [Bacteroidia bacterium]
MYSVQEIARICDGTLKGNSKTKIKSFLTDSRNLTSPEAVIFIAIKTEKNNGHQFIKELIDSGVKAFLINEGETELNSLLSNEVSFISVKDTLTALQTLAKHHRSLFNIPVIGITGSNGKTIVKEWLYQSLKQDHSICRSP